MKRFVVAAIVSLTLAAPTFGATHKNTYPVPCSELWGAVNDTLKNSGKYIVGAIDKTEMTAAYSMGGVRHATNSVTLKSQGAGCEMQIQSTYRGLMHDDASDFKSRVDASLAKLKETNPAAAAKPAEPGKPAEAAK